MLISAVLASALLGFSAVVPAQSAVGGTSISASKTMTGHLVSSYAWTLSKSASPSTLTLDAGQSAAVQYTVGATRSAPSMSAYFDGQICVKNTGSFATQGLRIVDSVSKPPKQTVLASTVVDVSANPVLTPGESHCYAYRVDLTTGVVPGATYKDTATVTITNKSGKTSGSAPSATTTLPTTIGTVNNASITVADTNGSTFTFSGTGTASYSQSFGCPADAGTHTNTISAPGFASAGASVTVTCSSPDLSLTKVADAASVDAGSPVGFTVTVANGGSGSASGVSVSDPLPAVSGVNWSIESQTGNACAITGAVGSQVLSCAIGTLAPSASYAVHVTSPTSFASCAALPNTATLTATNSPTQTANASTTVVCSDLSLTKVADAALVIAGGPVGFTVTVANGAGSGTANGVSVSDPLAPSVNWSIESQTGNACSITGAVGSQVLSCTVGSLASGASYTVHVVAGTSPAACGVMSNTATLTSTNSPTQSANASVAVMCPNLAVVKTADADTVAAGSQVGFTVTVSNSAFGAANGVAISDPLPAGVDWSIQSQTGNGCSITGAVGSQVLSCAVGALADGASYSVHIVGASGPEDCGLMSNTATATATNDSTETSTATITITC